MGTLITEWLKKKKNKNYQTIGWSFSEESCQIHLTLISHSQK